MYGGLPEGIQMYQTGSAGANIQWKFYRQSGLLEFTGYGAMDDYEIQTDDPEDPRKNPPKWSNLSAIRVTFSEGISYIGKSALRYNYQVTHISLPSTLESIGQNAFSGTDITSIRIPDSVTTIGLMAFSNTSLVDVIIPDTVTELGASAFAKCTKLKSIKIGAGVKDVRQGLFANTPRLESVELGPNVERIDKWLTTDSGLESIYIPASVKWISPSAFSARSADNLKEIIVDPKNEVYCSIDGVLYDKGCTELIRYLPGNTDKLFTVPSSIMYLGNNSFLYCDSLEEVRMPEGLVFIGYDAFSHCPSMKVLSLPDSVISISKNGINTGGTLDELVIGDGIGTVTKYSIPSISDVAHISLGKNVSKADTSALQNNPSLVSIDVDRDNQHFTSLNGVLYNNSMTQLLVAPCRMSGTLVLPETVNHISDNAFRNSELNNIILNGNLRIIGNGSFRDSSVNSLIIPDTVIIIGNEAFKGCSDLIFVYFVGDNPPSIGDGAFSTGAEVRVYSSMQSGFIDAYTDDSSLVVYHESEVFYSDMADRILHNPVYIVIVILIVASVLIIGERLVLRRNERK